MSVIQTGTFDPSTPIALGIRVHEFRDPYDSFMALDGATVEARGPCNLAVLPACRGNACFAEVRVTGFGTCMLAIAATTSDAEQFRTCWFRAALQSDDASDLDAADRMQREIDAEFDRCLAE